LGACRSEPVGGESTDAAELPERIDVVTALHACDTATDDAIAFGLQKQARAMVLVPCCQAEVARCLRQGKALQLARTPLAELWRHPLHTREMGSQITNVLRCLYLEASGYQVTVTELVGWEHSMKNELIIARYTGQKKRSAPSACAPSCASSGSSRLWERVSGCRQTPPCRRRNRVRANTPQGQYVANSIIGVRAQLKSGSRVSLFRTSPWPACPVSRFPATRTTSFSAATTAR
jgi:hypothetical protein